MMKLLIIDFDQTIADTSRLADYRKFGQWEIVKSRAGEIECYKGIDAIRKYAVDAGLKIAVVTNLPKHVVSVLCDAVGFKYDILIGASGGDYKFAKPSYEPMKAAMNRAGVRQGEVISIGDRCVDIVASHAADIYNTIGAAWGCNNETLIRELVFARPSLIAATVLDALEQIKKIVAGSVKFSALNTVGDDVKKMYRKLLWQRESQDVSRAHLDAGLKYMFSRVHYQGNRFVCLANLQMCNFKSYKDAMTHDKKREFRMIAIDRVANDLAQILPENANVAFMPTSKSEQDSDFDDRFVQVKNRLKAKGRGYVFHKPIKVLKSHEPIHTQNKWTQRKLEEILSHWEYVGFKTTTPDILYLIDDVITSGGHYSAYARLIKKYEPNIELRGLFWAAHIFESHRDFYESSSDGAPRAKVGLFW